MNDIDKKDMIEVLKEASSGVELSCAKTFDLIKEYSFFPDLAGFTMTQYKIKITHCQLGLFGYPEGKNIPVCEAVPESLEDEIYSNIEDEKLPCAAAWNIASKMKIKKIDITAACEKMGIKISKCQLGAF